MPEYKQEQIDEAKEWMRTQIKWHKPTSTVVLYHSIILSALSTAEQERDALASRCAELEARLQGAGWISVEEKKPEIGAICLVAKAGEVLGFSQWGSKDIPMPIWVFPKAPMYAAWIGQEVTHWMPLPEPPVILGEKKE